MAPIAISCIVFACVFGGALLGMLLRASVPSHHVSQDSKDVVKLAMGLVATMAALVLGLLTASAKEAFDAQDNEVQQSAANVILLDRVLAQYGPEAKKARDLVAQALAAWIDRTWPEDRSRPAELDASRAMPAFESLQSEIRGLSPQNDGQRWLQSQALQISSDVARTRWLLSEQAHTSVSMPLLVMLVFWLTALLVSFGLLAPRNATVSAALFVCALSVSGSILLILEMSQPFGGLVEISSAPLQYALAELGR